VKSARLMTRKNAWGNQSQGEPLKPPRSHSHGAAYVQKEWLTGARRPPGLLFPIVASQKEKTENFKSHGPTWLGLRSQGKKAPHFTGKVPGFSPWKQKEGPVQKLLSMMGSLHGSTVPYPTDTSSSEPANSRWAIIK
jgi:hypothetical protein